MDKINLYCMPFAGGNKHSYRPYVKHAPSFLNIVPMEIPGRGVRSDEPLLTDLSLISEDIFDQIKEDLNCPYAIYGHSMGGLLGYLLAKEIVRNYLEPPQHLFVTGCIAPSIADRHLVDHTLPRNDFFDEIKSLGGSPEEVLNDHSLIDFFEPILRADFQAVASFQYVESRAFSIPLSIAIGTEEKVTYEEAMAWQKETIHPIEVKLFPGNHFFIYEHASQIVQLMCRKLRPKFVQT